MKYSKVSLCTKNCVPESISNLVYTLSSNASVMDIYDAIEDAKTTDDLVYRLNRVPEMLRKISFDRVGDGYIRLKCCDPMGNISYLKIYS